MALANYGQPVNIADGLNSVVVTAAGALKVDGSSAGSGTTTANQGTANTTANAWPTKVTDGTTVVGVAATGTSLNVNLRDVFGTQIFGANNNSLFTNTGAGSVTSLTTATTGTGTALDAGAPHQTFSAFVLVNGTVTGGTVRVQVSMDNVNWANYPTDLITGALGTGVNAVLSSVTGAFRYARAAVVSSITGGGSVTVLLSAAG